MLNDPLSINLINPSVQTILAELIDEVSMTQTQTVRLADLGDGNSRRVGKYQDEDGANRVDFTISHAPSKENGSVPTQRSVIRIDRKIVSTEGVRATLSAYMVCVVPTITGTVGVVEAVELARSLACFILFGSKGGSGIEPDNAGELSRILLGEP